MSSILKNLLGGFNPKERRYILIVFFVFLAMGIVRLVSHVALLNLNNRWEEFSEKKTMEIVDGIHSAFSDIQEETAVFARKVVDAPSLRDLIGQADPPRERIFQLLGQLDHAGEFSLELYNRDLSLLAWSGKQSGVDSSDIRKASGEGPVSIVSQSALYTFLTVINPIKGADCKSTGVVVASRLVEVNYPLNNRFLTSSGIQSELTKNFGTNVQFEFGEGAQPSNDGRIVSADLFGLNGRKIGMVHVERPARASYLQNLRQLPESINSALAAILPLIIVIGFWERLKRQSVIAQVSVFLIFVWATRYIWLGVNFPSIFLHGKMFDPAQFASPFGFGLTRSIGELVISSGFLFVSGLFLLDLSVRGGVVRQVSSSKRWPVLGLLTPLIAGTLLMFLTRGFAEVIRSTVFDSKLNFTDPTTIFPHPLVGTMLFAILLLTLSLLFMGVILFLLSKRFSDHLSKPLTPQGSRGWVFVILLFVLVSFLFGQVHPNPQTSDVYRAVFVLVISFFAIVLHHEVETRSQLYSGQTLSLAIIFSIVIATPILDRKIHEHDREALRLYAAELTRPADTWVKVVLEESLNQMEADPETVEYLNSEDRDVISGLAFRLWAKSGLSREGFNCAVGVVREGRLESLFNLGLQRSGVAALISNLGGFTEKRSLQIQSGGKVRGLDRYVGTVPIFSTNGSVAANLVVIVVSGQGGLLRTETPEILQTPSALTLETQFRNLVVSEYVGGSLVQSTGEDFVRGHPLPEFVQPLLSSEKSPSVWSEERVGARNYESVYTPVGSPGGVQKVLALSMESLDIRWHIFNLLKVVFFYLIVGVFAATVFIIYAAYRQKRFRLSFRGRLLVALLSLATMPLLVLSYYDREFTNESRLEILRHQVEDELKVVGSDLLNHLGNNLQLTLTTVLTDSLCEKLAQETGSDFNVYVDNTVFASSRPELYDAELIDTRLGSSAYRNIILEGKNFFLQNDSIGRYPFLVGYQRLDDGSGHPIGAISVFTAFKHQAVDEELFKRSAFIFSAYAVIMILVVSTGVFFAYRIGSPIKKLTGAMRRVSRGDLDLSLEVRTKDELGELVAAFNKMTQDLKRIQKELAAAERELAWREMAKQVAHEIKNPLTPMKLSIQHLQQAYKDRAKDFQVLLEEVSKTIINQVDALSRIATEFSRYARMPERKYETCDIHELLRDAVRLFGREKNISFGLSLGKRNPSVIADQEELSRVFINVIRNAVQAIAGKGEIQVSTHLAGGEIQIEIADTGRGIPAEIKGRLFEPNFSTKSEGMGLGLAISKQTIADLNGRIEIESEVGKGTRVIITLPVSLA